MSASKAVIQRLPFDCCLSVSAFRLLPSMSASKAAIQCLSFTFYRWGRIWMPASL